MLEEYKIARGFNCLQSNERLKKSINPRDLLTLTLLRMGSVKSERNTLEAI